PPRRQGRTSPLPRSSPADRTSTPAREARMADHATAVAHQFDDVDQQREAATLGMWVFLATEVMLFGGLLTVYTVYRYLYARGFAEGSRQLDLWLGSINTVLLLTSSLRMPLGLHRARVAHR